MSNDSLYRLIKEIHEPQPMTLFETTSTWLTVVWIVVTAVGLFFAFRQWAMSSMATLLQSEVMLSSALQQIDSISADMLALTGHSPKTDEEKKLAVKAVEAAQMKHRSAIQNYLNSLDRFCYCISRRIMRKPNARREYSDVLDNAVSSFSQHFPEFDRHFPNIVDLRRKWSRR